MITDFSLPVTAYPATLCSINYIIDIIKVVYTTDYVKMKKLFLSNRYASIPLRFDAT